MSQFATSNKEIMGLRKMPYALAKKIIELERKNDKQFKEVFKILDGLIEETKNVDEVVMGFLKK